MFKFRQILLLKRILNPNQPTGPGQVASGVCSFRNWRWRRPRQCFKQGGAMSTSYCCSHRYMLCSSPTTLIRVLEQVNPGCTRINSYNFKYVCRHFPPFRQLGDVQAAHWRGCRSEQYHEELQREPDDAARCRLSERQQGMRQVHPAKGWHAGR